MALLTVGHGNLPRGDLADLLASVGVELVVDVRRYPSSRRNPRFDRGELESWLPAAGVIYRHEERLGGRRDARPDSRHASLEASFRGYADHMESLEWRDALEAVVARAAIRTVAVMCAENDWRHCHRRHIADGAVLLHDVAVSHLRHDGRVEPHGVDPRGRLAGDRIVYDQVAQPSLFD